MTRSETVSFLAALFAISMSASLTLGQASSGLPDPGRSGQCDTIPKSPGQESPGHNHDNGDVDWKDVCACSTTCDDGGWSPNGGGGVNPAWTTPNVIIESDPPEMPEQGPMITCSFADPDSVPACFGAEFVGDRAFNGSSPGYQGWGWFQHVRPELVVNSEDSPTQVRIYLGSMKVLDFSLVADSSPNVFVGNNGVGGVVLREPGAVASGGSSAEPELYRYYDTRGRVWTFFGYSTNGDVWLDAYGASGQLWTAANADGGGVAMYTGHATTASSALASGFVLDGSSHPTARASLVYDGAGRRLTFAYASVNGWPMLSSITTAVNTGSWTTVWTIDYAYYTSDVSGQGLKGDLKMITETRPLTSGGNEVRQTYFRYYTDGTTGNDLRHLMKFKVDPEGVRRATPASLDSMSDAALKAYSALYFEYNSLGHVTTLQTGAGCGCGGTDGLYEFEWAEQTASSPYIAAGTTGTGDWGAGRWRTRTVVTNPNGSRRALYFDEMGWLLARVHTDAADTSDSDGFDPSDGNTLWITKYERDGRGRPVAEYTPEAVDSSAYDHYSSKGSITVRGTTGLVRLTEYFVPSSGSNFLPFAVSARKIRSGETGTAVTLEEVEYMNPASSANGKTFGSTNPARVARPLATAHKLHRDSGKVDETTMSYTFYSGASSWAPKKRTVTLPPLETGDASGPASVTTETYFDTRGRTVLNKDGAGIFSFTMYADSGHVSKRIADATSGDSDASAAASATGATLPSSGLSYVSLFAHDAQGRLLTATLPGGRVVANYYSGLSDGRLVTLRTPALSGSNATGPVEYAVRNLAGRSEAQGVLALSSATALSGLINTASSDIIGAVQNSTLARLSASVYDGRGTRLDESRLFHAIPSTYPGSGGTHYDATAYKYDEGGRLRRTVDPTGTITYDIRDSLGRTDERWVGTNDTGFSGSTMTGTNNMVKVATLVFDGGGEGNGNVTSRTSHADSNSANDRVTTFTHDDRGQLMLRVNPQPPHQVFKRDRAGNVLAVGAYSSSPGVVDPTTTATNRVSLSETAVNSRGQTRLATRHSINQSTGASLDTLIESKWYDAAGRPIKSRGEQLTKSAYDAVGRATHRFVLAIDDDSSYADVAAVTGDTVMEEHQSLYDDSAKTGNLLMSVAISRHPNDTATTGALDAVGDGVNVVAVGSGSFKGRAQITSYYYDTLDRPSATVALGTNGGSTYTRSSDTTAGTSSATRLVSATAYNADGTTLSTTDPMGIVNRWGHDAAGRTIETIDNYVDGTPGGGANGDQDRVTQLTYSNGLMTSLTAKMPSGSDDQTTTYTYGVTQSGTLASDITNNRMLRQVQYPDSSGGSDVVRFAYNRQSQPKGVIDQAGNQVDTTYDTAAREVERAVTTLASGFDGSVRRIAMAYLARGPISTVTQYDAATGGNVTDQVRFEYDEWGQLERFRQDVDSAMDSAGDSVSGREAFEVLYAFAKSAPTSGIHTLRRTDMKYKADGTTFEHVGFTYGSGSSIGDSLSRVATVTVGASPTTVASYGYLGEGDLLGTTLTQADLRTALFSESGGTHTYADMDLFNRPTRWDWERIGGGAFYDVAVAYDRNSNPTSTLDHVHVRAASGYRVFDVVYTLDALNRVIGADEGHATGSPLAIQSGTRSRKELWNSLTPTGNWKNRRLDANGDGDYTDEEDRDEPSADQTFNKANEWTNRKIVKSGSDYDGYTYTHDAVGNLTEENLSGLRSPVGVTGRRGFVYDPFGRMMTVTGLLGESGPEVAERHRYNGLNFRIMWQYDADADSSLEDSERYYLMHDERWRIIAAFRNQDASPKEAFVFHAAGQGGFGGSSYIDSVILRDRDANGGGGWAGASDGTLEERRYYCQNWRADVVAITKSDGTPLEYVRYSPYGEPTVYPAADIDMNGKVEAADYAEWNELINGYGTTAVYTPNITFDDSEDSLDDDLFAESYAANSGLSGKGRLSSPEVGNRIGYAGYQWDPASRLYQVRHRWYFPEIGRWGRRDPAGYVGQMSLYGYVAQQVLSAVDSSGLRAQLLQPPLVPPLPEFDPNQDWFPTPTPTLPPPVSTPPFVRPPFVGPPRPVRVCFFDGTDIVCSWAASNDGPWDLMIPLYRPEELDRLIRLYKKSTPTCLVTEVGIYCHAEEGNAWLGDDSIEPGRAYWRSFCQALGPGTEIDFVACNLGKGESGKAFLLQCNENGEGCIITAPTTRVLVTPWGTVPGWAKLPKRKFSWHECGPGR